MDFVGLQITTAGEDQEKAVEEFQRKGDSESALLLQGLGDRIAEDFAEYIHQLLKQRAGLKRDQGGKRYSPGYPALESLSANKTLFNILGADDLGISLTDSNGFYPTSATGAVVCFHPDASYS